MTLVQSGGQTANLSPSGLLSTEALTEGLRRSQRAEDLKAFGLLAPLLVFLLLTFILPVIFLLSRSVADPDVAPALPYTLAALERWNGESTVPDAAYAALIQDFRGAQDLQSLAKAASRLNQTQSGLRALIMSTKSKLDDAQPGDPKSVLVSISPKWADAATWSAIRQAKGPFTDFYLLAALDLQRDAQGSIERVAPSDRVFLATIGRTFEIALGVTILAILVGFPYAYLAANVSPGTARILMFLVLLPFWTSMLVRTLSWAVLLQKEGIINHALLAGGLIDSPLALIFNRFAVYIALLHIFVPYMVLPLYSVMKTVPPAHLRAASSLGAAPGTVFTSVYLPQIGPGIAAGALLVFIQCLGVFVIPAILGGPNDQGIPYMIAFYVNRTLNWGLAASLSIILLVSVFVFYWIFTRLARTTNLSIG